MSRRRREPPAWAVSEFQDAMDELRSGLAETQDDIAAAAEALDPEPLTAEQRASVHGPEGSLAYQTALLREHVRDLGHAIADTALVRGYVRFARWVLSPRSVTPRFKQ